MYANKMIFTLYCGMSVKCGLQLKFYKATLVSKQKSQLPLWGSTRTKAEGCGNNINTMLSTAWSICDNHFCFFVNLALGYKSLLFGVGRLRGGKKAFSSCYVRCWLAGGCREVRWQHRSHKWAKQLGLQEEARESKISSEASHCDWKLCEPKD